MKRWVRQAVVGVAIAGIGALGWGPARYLVAGDHAASADSMSLFGDPYAPPSMGPWPTGIADTEARDGILGAGREAPTGAWLTPADARARPPGTAYVLVTGGAAGHRLAGVGTVLTGRDVTALLDLDQPARDDTIRYLSGTDGAALGLFAMTGEPRGRPQLVNRRSTEQRRRLLLTGDDDVKAFIDLSAQQRPDLSVLVTPPGYDAAAALTDVGLPTPGERGDAPTNPATMAYRSAVEEAVDEIFPALAARREVVAPHLLTGTDDDGLFELGADGATPTARGAAWGVAALAVPPGSKLAPVRATGGIRAMAFARPQGGASVLVWNPGPARRITVDLPYGDQVHRVRVKIAAGALTAVLLAK